MKRSLLLLILLAIGALSFASLPGGTYNIPGNYATLAAAITDLNTGVTGPVVINLLTGNPQTAPSGGYSITTLTGTTTNTIIIQGNGNTITAGLQTAGSQTDAIFKIIGGDYITIQNFVMQENPGNTITTHATNTMTEFGVALFLTSVTDGAQNNTIQNNTISLGSTYQDAIGIFSTSSSSSTNGTLEATVTSGTNSNNKFYGNTISNVAYGMYFICPPVTATLFESGIDVGGSSVATGNTINFGSATSSTLTWNRYATVYPAGIYFRNSGQGDNVSYNTITSNNVSYPQSSGVGGVASAGSANPTGVTYTTTRSNNTITLSSSGTTAITGIDFGYGIAAGTTLLVNNNTISINQTPTSSASAAIIGIKSNYIATTNTISSNTVTINQTPGGGQITSPVTGIIASSAATNATNEVLSILSNIITINQNAGSGSYGLSPNAISYITLATAKNIKSVDISYNQLLTGTGASIRLYQGLCVGYGINYDGNISNNVNLTHNTLNINFSGSAGTFNGLFSTGTVNTTNETITDNSITLTNTAGNMVVNAIYAYSGTSATGCQKAINNNTISISGTNTGAILGIFPGYSHGTITTNNITVNTASTGIYGIQTYLGPGAYSINGNSLSLTSSSTSPGTIIGIYASNQSTGPFQIFSNTISALNLTGIITTNPTVSGIQCEIGTGNNVYSNVITGFSIGASSSTGSPIVNGISITNGTNNIYKNKICSISTNATGTSTLINGIALSGGGAGTPNAVYNNLIGGLSAPAAGSADALRGISITSTTVSSNDNVYFNTILLNGTSTGANFGTTGIYQTASATATTAALDLRNNIVVNKSSHNGTGMTVALRRSSGTAGMLANFATTSNNNCLYAGAPGPGNLVYYDGTSSAQGIAAYQAGVFPAGTIAPRDINSFAEDAPFLSVACGDATFLHINPAIPTEIESGGTPIAGITDDFDGNTRNVTTPDVGADEGNFSPADHIPPSITYTALNNTSSLANRSLAVTITDPSGVGTGANQPVLYWKINGYAYSGPLAPTTIVGNVYNFSFGSGVSAGDVVSYFVVAQDNASSPTPNVGSFPPGATVTYSPPLASAGPSVPSTYSIIGTLCGNKTVGTGGDYPSLTSAFADLSTKELCGALTLTLLNSSYTTPDETFPLVIPGNILGSSSANTITVKPNLGVNPVISGTIANGPVLKILNNYVVINGSNTAGSALNLTITNTSVTSPNVILIGSTGNTSISGDTVKNCQIINGVNNISGSKAVVIGDATTIANPGYFNNIGILNTNIQNSYYGIYANAYASSGNGSVLIKSNTLNTIGSNALHYTGIFCKGLDGCSITQNDIGNFDPSQSQQTGVWLDSGTKNAVVERNDIHDLNYKFGGGFGNKGIVVSANIANANILVKNNFIHGITGDGDDYTAGYGGGYCPSGIYLTGIGGQTGIMLYANSIYLYGNTLNNPNAASFGICLDLGSSADVQDNIIENDLGLKGSTGFGAVGIYAQDGSYQFTSLNYNDYSINPPFSAAMIGMINTTSYTTLSAWKSATGKEANGVSGNPQYISTDDLHIQPSVISPVNNAGIYISTVTNDFDGTPRQNPPDIGADEYTFIPPVVNNPASFTANAASESEIDLAFTPNAASNNVIIVWNDNGNFSTPSGTPPAVGTSFAGGTLLYKGLTSPVLHTGLTSQTTYYYKAFSYTGSFYSTGINANATTPCTVINSFPFTESFDGTTFLPSCWSKEQLDGDATWHRRTSDDNFDPAVLPHSGSGMAVFNSFDWDGTSLLVTPTLKPPTDGYRLKFWMYRDDGFGSNPDLVNIYYNTNQTLTGATMIGTVNRYYSLSPAEATANQWYQYTMVLPGGSGGNMGYIFFEGVSAYGNDILVDDITIESVPVNKTLNLSSVFLEGFYTGSGTMMQAMQQFPDLSFGPYWTDGSADHITVELHTPGNYATVVYASTDVPLDTTGTATVTIPGSYDGSYYLTIKQRNHLETVSALPLSFAGSTITYAFDALTQAYDGNMTQILEADGETMSPALIFGGDVTQDGQIESDDINAVGNDAANYVMGYVPTDIVPDGQVESADINIVGNNAALYIFAHIPM